MAKNKTTEVEVATLKHETMENGMIRLSSEKGIRDKRTNTIHHDVICSEQKEKFFEEIE